MKKTITSRLEVLLAKIAGKDAGIETMAPGVPINLSEELMLDIADRLDGIAENTTPKVTAEDNGDVLTVVDGAWAKAAPSGGGSYAAEWTRQKENICFASLDATGDYTWDVVVQCSDGAMVGSLTVSYDSGIGEWSFEWGDWTNSEVMPVPDIENYTNVIQNNIAAAVAPLVMRYPQGTTLTWTPLPTIVIASRLPYVDAEIWA